MRIEVTSKRLAVILSMVLALEGPAQFVEVVADSSASEKVAGSDHRIVGPSAEPIPVVNEGLSSALRVVDASGVRVKAKRWRIDNPAIATVDKKGVLSGVRQGYVYVSARTSAGTVGTFAVVARVAAQNGATSRGDTQTDVRGAIYLASPEEHVVFRSSGFVTEAFAGQAGVPAFRDGHRSEARFNGPTALGVDNRAEGGVFVADTSNNCVRKIAFDGLRRSC
jgi:hypothetical protein